MTEYDFYLFHACTTLISEVDACEKITTTRVSTVLCLFGKE